MQKRFVPFLSLAILAVVIFSSCSKTNKQGRYIPAKAGFVMLINGEALNTKLPWEEIKKNDWFKKMNTDTSMSAFTRSILDNPENSGINVKSDIMVFVVKDSSGAYTAVEGFVKDETKFKQFVMAGNKEAKESSKNGYTFFTDKKSSVGYNKERFVYTVNMPGMGVTTMPPVFDTTANSGMQELQYNRDMLAVTLSVFEQKEEASLAGDKKFTALVDNKSDACFWLNAQYINSIPSLGGMGAMMDLGKIYEGAVTAGTLNFNNGKIDLDLTSYAGKEMTELYKKYTGSSFDKTMVNNIPSQNLAGMFVFNFKPEGIKEFLKLLKLDGFANLGAGQIGFNLDDFVKANKGDIMIAVTDVKTDSILPKFNFIFATSINDKPSFNKIIDAGKKLGGPMLSGNAMAEKIAYSSNDKYFVLANDKATADAYLAGSSNKSVSVLDKISGGPFGGYVNFQYIFNAMKPKVDANDSLDIASFNATQKMWDNLIINGGNYKDGGITQHWEINLVDKNTNSLKQLNSYGGVMAGIEEQKKERNKSLYNSDDVMPPVAVDTARSKK